jgi:hypothetical protein
MERKTAEVITEEIFEMIESVRSKAGERNQDPFYAELERNSAACARLVGAMCTLIEAAAATTLIGRGHPFFAGAGKKT